MMIKLTVEFDRELDGRHIAIVPELPGVMTCRKRKEDALSSVQVLALKVIADRIQHSEIPSPFTGLTFEVPAL